MIWLLSIISGILYRFGGWKQTLWRDIGVPIVALVALWLLDYRSSYWMAHLCFFGLMWGALSTYWDRLFKKDNFFIHGFMIGIALLPFCFFGMSLWLLLTRAMVLGLGMGLVNKYVNKWALSHSDIIEEFFRGVIIIATLIIFI